PDGRLPAAGPATDAPGQPTDDDAQGVLSARPGGRRVDHRAGPGVPAGLSDPGGPGRVDGTPVAAVGARPSADRGPDAGAVGRAAAAAAAGAAPCRPGQGPPDAESGGPTHAGGGGRRRLS